MLPPTRQSWQTRRAALPVSQAGNGERAQVTLPDLPGWWAGLVPALMNATTRAEAGIVVAPLEEKARVL